MGNLMKKLEDGGHLAKVSGKDYVLFSGLLELAHEHGIESIESECLSVDASNQTAFYKTTAKGSRGTFTGHGDGMPSNLSKMILPSFYRMAETRSVCRALRLYLGIGMCAKDELPSFDSQEKPAPDRKVNTGLASDAQVAKIFAVAGEKNISREQLLAGCKRDYRTTPERLTRAEASELIKTLLMSEGVQA